MKKTLLEIVQNILSSLDGEEVNSISDTVESMQVAGYVKNSYEEILDSLHLPRNKQLFELIPTTDHTKPVLMYLPEGMSNLEWLKYDNTTPTSNVGYRDVQYMNLSDFFSYMYSDNELQYGDVNKFQMVTPKGSFDVFYRNNRMPTYYTTFDDQTLIFDAHDTSVEDTLMANRTTAYGEATDTFVMDDDYVPNLPPDLFALLENEAKSQAFIEQKQSDNPIADKRARKAWIRTQNDKVNLPYPNTQLNSRTNYGRNGTGYYYAKRILRNGK